MPAQHRDVLVVGGTLAGTAAALAAIRSGARTRLLVAGAAEPGPVPPIPQDVTTHVQRATDAVDVDLPEEDGIAFKFRARRVRRWLDELDIANDQTWATGLHAALLERIEREGGAIDETSIPVRLIKGQDGVTGAVLVDGARSEAHEADTTILAGGGAGFLWPSPEPTAPPTGLALALRAELPMGDLGHVHVPEDEDGRRRFVDAVQGDARGHLEVSGVAVCGEVLASPLHAHPELCHVEDVVRGLEAGAFQGHPSPKATPELVQVVDEPMPPGFAKVKLDRLRGLLSTKAGSQADPASLEEAHAELLSLRGEFADYARARADTEVHVLHQAGDLALAHVASRLGQD